MSRLIHARLMTHQYWFFIIQLCLTGVADELGLVSSDELEDAVSYSCLLGTCLGAWTPWPHRAWSKPEGFLPGHSSLSYSTEFEWVWSVTRGNQCPSLVILGSWVLYFAPSKVQPRALAERRNFDIPSEESFGTRVRILWDLCITCQALISNFFSTLVGDCSRPLHINEPSDLLLFLTPSVELKYEPQD